MIKKTKDYDMFVFREDNRTKINQAHVKRLKDSISSRNLLELRPIMVNQAMEVIDGQHRLLAAKELGVEIYYQQDDKLDFKDIINLNISKAWSFNDFLNYYVKNDFPEYVKLDNFIKRNKISLKVGLSLLLGQQHTEYHDFKIGNFKFVYEEFGQEVDICWETIHYIKKINGFSNWTNSTKFWKAMIQLARHEQFDVERWRMNMKKLISDFSAKPSAKDYVTMVQYVYNYRHQSKIELSSEGL